MLLQHFKNINLVHVHQFKCTSIEVYSLLKASLLFGESQTNSSMTTGIPFLKYFATAPERCRERVQGQDHSGGLRPIVDLDHVFNR